MDYLIIFGFSTILSIIYYSFYKSKNETVFIWFLTFIIYLIVNTLLKIEISVWMWIGLFAVLSLLSFRKTFSTTTLKYFLIAIALWIINAFSSYESYIISIFILLILFTIEYFFLSNKSIKLELKIKIEYFDNDLSKNNIKKRICDKYWNIYIKQITITQEYIIIKWIK